MTVAGAKKRNRPGSAGNTERSGMVFVNHNSNKIIAQNWRETQAIFNGWEILLSSHYGKVV